MKNYRFKFFSISLNLVHSFIFCLVILFIISCKKDISKLLNPDETVSADVQWAKDYFVENLQSSVNMNINNPSNNAIRINKKIPKWSEAEKGESIFNSFVEIPLNYTNKISPNINLVGNGQSTNNKFDETIFNASFDRLIIYKDANGDVNQRIISYVPDKEYLLKHNGNITHNRINKLDKDFYGYLHYKDWDGNELFILRIENGVSVRKYSTSDLTTIPNTLQSSERTGSNKKISNAPIGENCVTITTTYYITWCYYTGDNFFPDYCDAPEQLGQTVQTLCEGQGGSGGTGTTTIDCSNPLNFDNAQCNSLEDTNPCEEKARLALLAANAIIKKQDSLMRNSIVPGAKEWGTEHTLTNLTVGTYKDIDVREGNIGSFTPVFTWNSVDGFVIGDGHTHVGGTAPSPTDIFDMAKNLSHPDVVASGSTGVNFYKKNVFVNVVTESGNYMVTVKNWPQFLKEYQTYKAQGREVYNQNYLQIGGTGAQEAGFRFLTKFGSFLNIFKADVNSTAYKPLTLNTVNGEVIVQFKICPGDIPLVD